MKNGQNATDLFAKAMMAALFSGTGSKDNDNSEKKQAEVFVVTVTDESGESLVSAKGKAVLAISLDEVDQGIKGHTIIHGNFSMDSTIAALEALDSLKEKLIEQLVKANLS